MPKTLVQPVKKRVSNEDLAARLDAIEKKLELRLNHLEEVIGLNGSGETLKTFLEQLRADNINRLAWRAVWTDLKSHLGWIKEPKKLLWVFVSALIGGTGWAVVNHALVIWPIR